MHWWKWPASTWGGCRSSTGAAGSWASGRSARWRSGPDATRIRSTRLARSRGGRRGSREGLSDDTEALVGEVSTVLAEEQPADRSPPQPGHVRLAGGRREARARGAVLQARGLSGDVDARAPP